ncbi:MAG: glycosyltransferase family 4 protein [Salinivirgaceae bacterium]
MKKTKILFITPFPPPFGGIAILSQSILNAGLKDYFDVISINTSKKALREKIDSVRFSGILNSFKNYLKLIKACQSNRDAKYAYITGTSNWAILRDFLYLIILKFYDIEILFNLHGTRKLEKSNGLIKWVSTKAMAYSTYILSPTRVDFEAAKKLSNRPAKVKLFYNATNLSVPVEPKYKNLLNAEEDVTLIGIGRLSDAKGAYDLIPLAIQLIDEGHPIKLIWIGRGAYEADDKWASDLINKQSPKTQKRIHLLKDLTEEEKFNYLQQADLFVLPTKNDNLPVSLLESMACGLPVISTYMGAIPEVIIPNKNGWLINHSNTSELEAVILTALQQKDKFPDMGKQNIEDFNRIFNAVNRVNELVAMITNSPN